VDEIARSADRGASLTQQLLAFSRKQQLLPRRVALADVVAQSEPVLRRLVRSNVELVIESDALDAEVYADPLQLEQVLTTLVRNSNDAMPRGGRITIATRALELSDAATDAAPTQEIPTGRYALLSVSDTGIGMDADVVARLFEPFFTTKEVGAGTGLGLASLYGIVRQSGGFVDVDSTPNVGTTFRVYLPLGTPPTRSSRPTPLLSQPA
jgi:signal transduction histidine kinase